MEWLVKKFEMGGFSVPIAPQAQVVASPSQAIVGTPTPTKTITPKIFMVQKKPETDVERVACLAYYLNHFRNNAQFKTTDLTKLNQDAAQPRIANPSRAVDNATKQSQFLTPAGGGKKQITPRGEALVEALPEREKVKAALADLPIRRRARKSKKAA